MKKLLSKSVRHALEVGICALIALGIAELAVLVFPELHDVLLNSLTQVLGTAILALFAKAQRESPASLTGDFVNE